MRSPASPPEGPGRGLGGQRPAESDEIVVDGEPYGASREQSQAHDVRALSEEPLRNGCVPPMTVVDNLNLRSFDLGLKKSRRC
jgi:simple sugar transport system ATP-binding protein